MNFLSVEKKRQLEWKLTTKTLPREARVPGLYRSRMYPFCLPLEYASYNLFHEIRDEALRYFEETGIIWHSSALPGTPTNHLCSSQIFAVNLLFPFMNQPEALATSLKPFCADIKRLLPVEDDRYVAFEWIGDYNYLGEIPKLGRDRHRGAGNTSIDAMMTYEATDGRLVMLLTEIKYTESYASSYKRFRTDGTDRIEPYRDFFYGPSTPIDLTANARIEDFMYEPFYQLLRQQLLASRIIELGHPKVDLVKVLHIHARENRELKAVTSPGFRQFGSDAYDVWQQLLVNPSDFMAVSSEDFFKAVPCRDYPVLEPWYHYMHNRYVFLK